MPLIMCNFKTLFRKDENKSEREYDKFLKENTKKYYKTFDTQDRRFIYYIYFNNNKIVAANDLLIKMKEFNEVIFQKYKAIPELVIYKKEESI